MARFDPFIRTHKEFFALMKQHDCYFDNRVQYDDNGCTVHRCINSAGVLFGVKLVDFSGHKQYYWYE